MRAKPYPRYKPSGVEWLESLPETWEVRKFSREVAIAEGQVDPEADPYASMLLIGPEHVESATGKLLRSESAADQFAESGKYLCRRGDVIYSKIRPALRKVVLAPSDCLCSADMYPLRGRRCIENRFLYWLLLSKPFAAWSVLESDRVAMPKINRDTLNELRMPIPSPAEQRAIADFLDRETGRMDQLIAKKRELIERLKEKRTALISRTVTRGLPVNPPLKPSGLDWLSDIPAHWNVKPVKLVARIGNGSTPSRDNPAYWEDGDYPWLNSSAANLEAVTGADEFVTPLALAECHLPKITPPAVLVGITGQGRTRGMATTLLVEATINQHMAYLKPISSQADVGFLRRVFDTAYSYLRSESDGGGSTKGAITCEQIGQLGVPVPPIDEQRGIAAYLDHETAKLDALAAKVETAIDRLQEYRTALITAAVTGKIDLRTRP